MKISSLLFAGIGTVISLVINYSESAEEDPLVAFVLCELFGYGIATFIFLIAIIEGYTKAKIVLRQFNKIPEKVRKDYSLELIQKPLNPKYWFMQFQIVQRRDGDYYELDQRTKQETLDNWI